MRQSKKVRHLHCPRCRQSVQVPDDLAEPHCIRCGEPLAAVETHITANPTLLPPQAIQPIDQFERDGEEPRAITDWDEFRATSPAVQRELLELARRPMPDLRNVYLKPLPPEMPAGTEGWKRPLGTIEGPGENLILNWIGRILAVIFGTLFLALSAGALASIARGEMPVFGGLWIAMAFLLLAGLCAWGLARRRKPPYTMWVFEEGLFWQLGWSRRGHAPWQDVERFQTGHNPMTRTPICWITMAGRTDFEIDVATTPALIPLLEYMEIRLTATQLLPKLQQLHAGQSLGFGAVRLDQYGIHGRGFAFRWSEVERVVRDRDTLFVQVRGLSEWLPVPYVAVSFPTIVMAIAHIMIEEEGTIEPEA